jgi:hypothetical protein
MRVEHFISRGFNVLILDPETEMMGGRCCGIWIGTLVKRADIDAQQK